MKDTYKIHTSYIIVILVAIIILLITVKWAAVPELVGYINFAATLASLLLAVVAILYAMYSNSSIAQNIGELDRAATDIRTAAIGIESTNAELHRRVNEIPPQIEHVNKSMDAIRAQLLDTTTHAGLLQERDSEMHTTSTEGNTDRCLRALLANLKKEEIRYLLHIDGDTKYLMELTSLYKEMVGAEYKDFHDDFHWGQVAAVERWLVLMRLLKGIVLVVNEVTRNKFQIRLHATARNLMERVLDKKQ